MIAKTNQHYEESKLRQLLDEQLSKQESREVESHLSDCQVCRTELDRIAGEEYWWTETVEVLSNSTLSPRDDSIVKAKQNSRIDRTLDSSVAWLRPLLESPDAADDQTCLGHLNQYPIEKVIGQGGMGVVLRGVDPELNRPVAIKVLSPHLAGVGAARARFMREAQAAAAIVHPSIVPIYGVIPAGPLPYIVMPVISGGNLQQRIDSEGPLELAEVLRIGVQVAEGLAAAHRGGVIHRDIKPANILIEEGNGRALISDFGLARALDDASMTCSGMIAGTPQYMSPEQARGEPIDGRSDLFSLGSLLYALATGRPPFRADTPLAVLLKITQAPARPVHEINDALPAWFDVLLKQLMQIDVNKRINSAEDAASLLQLVHAHVRQPAIQPLPDSLRNRKRFPMARTGATALAAACVLACAIVGTSYMTSHGKASVLPAKSTSLRVAPSTNAPVAIPASANHSYAMPPYAQTATPGFVETENQWIDFNSTIELQTLNSTLEFLERTELDSW